MLSALPEMMVQLMHARGARLRVPPVADRKREVLRIAFDVRPERPLRIRNAHAEHAAGLQNAVRLAQNVLDLVGVLEVLERVLAVHHRHGRVGKRQPLAQVQGEVSLIREEIDVHPPRLDLTAAAEMEPQLALSGIPRGCPDGATVAPLQADLAPERAQGGAHSARRSGLYEVAKHESASRSLRRARRCGPAHEGLLRQKRPVGLRRTFLAGGLHLRRTRWTPDRGRAIIPRDGAGRVPDRSPGTPDPRRSLCPRGS